MTKEVNFYFSELVISGIEKYLNLWKKIWIIINKKWFSNWILCYDCGFVPQCNNCSVGISFYKWEFDQKFGICHICKTQYPVPIKCPKCGLSNIKEFGLWTQKVAEFIKKSYAQDSLVIESETVNSPSKIKKLMLKIWDYQVFIWTSLLNTPIKGLDFDLLIYLNADLGLNVPDYTSNERNFWFLYEWFTKHLTQNILVQTFNPDHYSIRYACKMDKEWFYKTENIFREEHNYPPFGEVVIIMYKNEVENSVFSKVDRLYKELLFLQKKYWLENNLHIYSTPPMVYKVFGKYRYNIVLKWDNVASFLDIVYSKLNIASRGFKIDIEPMGIV